MRIVLAGASGFIGRWLRPELESLGHELVQLVRDPGRVAPPERVLWSPGQAPLEPSILDGAGAVLNLAGRNIARTRWTTAERRRLLQSRLVTTSALVDAIRSCSTPPAALLNASATGFYGSRGDEELSEDAPPGEGFLAELARSWEAAALEARSAGTRVVLLRLGMVVGRGGALARMLPAFRLGLGGPLGDGRQWWPWVAMEDVLGAIVHVLHDGDVVGPVNVVSPCAVRCREFVRTLGVVLGRSTFLALPAPVARFLLGTMADELLLSSQRVLPGVLQSSGYAFRLPDLPAALRAAMD